MLFGLGREEALWGDGAGDYAWHASRRAGRSLSSVADREIGGPERTVVVEVGGVAGITNSGESSIGGYLSRPGLS